MFSCCPIHDTATKQTGTWERDMPSIVLLTAFLVVAPSVVPAQAAEGAVLSATAGERARGGLPKPEAVPEGVVWVLYPVTLRETSGRAGITLLGYKKCYEGGETFHRYCTDVLRDIAQLYGADRLPPGGSLVTKRPAWVWSEPTGKTITVTVTYFAEDDIGRPLEAEYRFRFLAE